MLPTVPMRMKMGEWVIVGGERLVGGEVDLWAGGWGVYVG